MRRKLAEFLKSTYVRYVGVYALVFALILCLLVGFMFARTRKTAYDRAVSAEIATLAGLREQSEGLAGAMRSVVGRISLSDEAVPFVFENAPDKAYDLIQSLKPYAASYDFFEQMYLVFFKDDTLYAPLSSCSVAMYVNHVAHYERLSPALLAAALTEPGAPRVLPGQRVSDALIGDMSARAVTFVYPMGERGNIAFLVSEDKFSLLREEAEVDSLNRYILYNGEIILSGESFAFNQNYVYETAQNQTIAKTSARRFAGREYILISLPGENRAFQYITVIPLSAIHRAAAREWMGVSFALALIVLPCAILALLMSRKNLSILRTLKRRIPELPDAGKDELNALEGGVMRLTERLQADAARFDAELPARRARFVRALTQGAYTSRAEAGDDAREADVCITGTRFALYLLAASVWEDARMRADEWIASAPDGIHCAYADDGGARVLIVCFSDDDSALTAFADCAPACAGGAPAAMSGVYGELTDMPEAYREVAHAYARRFLFEDARVLRYDNARTPIKNAIGQSHGYIDAIRQALAGGDGGMLNARLDDFMMFITHTDMSASAFELIYHELIGAIIGQTDSGAEELYNAFSLENALFPRDMDAILRKQCTRAMEAAKDAAQTPLRRDILAYMLDNFADRDFSFAALADRFGVSTTRLTQLFKESVRMTPTEYLTMLRMEKSKNLLKQTDMSIKDICAEAGYYDVSSYIRRFKQYAGVSPLKYRRGTQGEEENTEVE